MDVRQKTVLITGGSRGIGLALAHALLQRGCRIINWSRSQPEAHEHGIETRIVDVTSARDVQEAAAGLPYIDILVNNAGVMRRGGILDITEDDFDALVDVNVKGAWLVLKYAVPRMNDGGIIVQMASRHAVWLPDNPAVYGLTKQWTCGMADLVARAYPRLSVKTLCLGPVDTALSRHGVPPEEMVKKEKIMRRPEDVAEEIVALLEVPEKKRLMYNPEANIHEQE